MCISNNQYDEPRVTFEDTILAGFEVQNPDGTVERIMGYYNKVRAQAAKPVATELGWDVRSDNGGDDFGWHIAPPTSKQGNAMLFAVPAKKGTLGLIPVADFPQFMEDYKRAVVPPPPMSRGFAMSFSAGGDDDAPVVVKGFDGGTYDVVIAQSATSILGALGGVDADKRPSANAALWKKLDILYPGFTFVLFCFAEKDAEQAGCALIKYQPMAGTEHLLFLPALDGHNGDVETGAVTLNHTLVVGSYRMPERAGKRVRFSDEALRSGELPYYLPKNVLGKVIPAGTRAPQGDFVLKIDDIRSGTFRAKRQVPPGWKRLFPQAETTQARPYMIDATTEFAE